MYNSFLYKLVWVSHFLTGHPVCDTYILQFSSRILVIQGRLKSRITGLEDVEMLPHIQYYTLWTEGNFLGDVL